MTETRAPQRRRWADVVLILAGLSLFGLAVWFPPFSTTDEAPAAISLWPNYALAGGLIILALFLVWTQNRSDTETIGTFRTGRALDRLWGAKGDNIFLVKLSYWWNP